MEIEWERAEVACPACDEILGLRPWCEEIWCPRCETGFRVTHARSARDPSRSVLVLQRKAAEDAPST